MLIYNILNLKIPINKEQYIRVNYNNKSYCLKKVYYDEEDLFLYIQLWNGFIEII